MIAPRKNFTDHELVNLFLWGKDEIYGRFVVNELMARQSDALKQYEDIFLHTLSTRISYLNAINNIDALLSNKEKILFDDIPFLINTHKKYNVKQTKYFDFLKKSLKQLQMSPTLSAAIMRSTGDEFFDDIAYDEKYLDDNKCEKNNIKIIGITKIKNEGELAYYGINHMLGYCDEVIVSDASTEELNEEYLIDKKRVFIVRQPTPFNESRIYNQLFQVARKRKATHVMHMDVDERINPLLTPEILRRKASMLQIGEALTVPWDQLFSASRMVRKIEYNKAFGRYSFSKLLPPHKDLIVCDDGESIHHEMPLHCPYFPANLPTKRFIMEASLYHLEALDIENYILKCNGYFLTDYLINKNADMCMLRYLPRYFRNLRTLVGDINHEDCSVEIEDSYIEYQEGLAKKKKSLWITTNSEKLKMINPKVRMQFEQFYFDVDRKNPNTPIEIENLKRQQNESKL